MERLIPYIPVGGMFIFLITGFIGLKVSLRDRPTFSQTERRYTKKEVCDQARKSFEEKVNDIPNIKETVTRLETKIDFIIKNGK